MTKRLDPSLVGRREYHGCSRPGNPHYRIFTIWNLMRHRCDSPSNQDYKYYGGLGIRVCKAWSDSFAVFRDWAYANGYRATLTIDRYPDPRGNYEPGNCRWIPQAEQNRNKRNNIKVTAFGETKCITEWERDPRCVVGHKTLKKRVAAGLAPEEAMAIPGRSKRA